MLSCSCAHRGSIYSWGSDYLRVVSHFLCFIIVRWFDYNVSLWWYIAIARNPPCELNNFVLQQQQNLGLRFGTSKMHLSPHLCVVCSKAVVLLSMIRCWLLLPLWDSVIVLCFVVRHFVSILDLQLSWWGRESWLLCFVCLPGVLRLLCGSSSRCHEFVCSLWLWYFLIILTYYFFFI